MQRRFKSALVVAALAGSAATAAHGQSLSTIFQGGNSGSAGGIVFFDANITNANGIVLTSIDTNTAALGLIGATIYTRSGTYVGNEQNQGAWTLRTTGSGAGAGAGLPSSILLDTPVNLPPGVTAIAIVGAAPGFPSFAHTYTNGTGANQFYSNSDLSLTLGAAQNVPFAGAPFTPRVWNGTLYYSPANPNATGACCFNDGSCQFITVSACTTGGGSFRGENVQCAAANCPQPGACCLPTGACDVRFQNACTSAGGTWSGANTTCTPGLCPTPGACCMPDGCALVMEGVCNFAGGTFQGAGTACSTCSLPAGVLFINGPVSTGPSTRSGVPAPAGSTWSECAHPYDIPPAQAPANSIAGFRAIATTDRIADDFTVPTGEQWQISEIRVYMYQTGSPTTSTFTTATMRIWNGPPNAPGSSVIWGDTTTNRLANSSFTNIYRAFNTVVGITCGGGASIADQTRPIMQLVIPVNESFSAGTYWIDYNATGTLTSGPWAPLTTIAGSRSTKPNANALQSTNNGLTWVPVLDTGQGCSPAAVAQDYAFRILGTVGSSCYPNCDNSTVQPILNIDDFTCFINEFAVGQGLPPAQQVTHYSNCDGSTTAPVLNIDDFTCFINSFAAGCP